MKSITLLIIVALFSSLIHSIGQQADIYESIDNKSFNPGTLLWYETPAQAWEEALPVGNGRLVDTDMIIDKADAVTLYIVIATNFVNYRDVSADQNARVAKYLADLQGKTYVAVHDAAVKDYKGLFDRVRLDLPVTDNSWLPTDKRMTGFETNSDPNLAS